MRTITILRELLPFVLSLFRDRRRWIFFGSPLLRSPAFHERRATRLVESLARLGPTFVKFGQIFAGRNDLLAEPYVHALSTLTDRVPPVPLADIRRVIVDSYGRTPEELFERFDEVPIAAASLGQVHRARCRGRDVAVKVLRPGVESLVQRDIASARTILGWIERRFPNPHVRGLRAAVEEFALRVQEEMDFRLEAANADEFRASFARSKGIRIPEILPEMTRQRVLVLEFLEGTRIDALGPRIAAGELRASDIVRRVLELYVEMMLVDGLFHADPHPGNLLVAPDGALVLLDFGMVVRVSRDRRRQILNTAIAAISNDAEGVVAGFRGLGLVESGDDDGTLRKLTEALLALASRRTTTQERIQYLADEVLSTMYDWPVVLPGDLVYFARTAALIEGLGIRYDARFNALQVATPILLRHRSRILAALEDPAAKTDRDWASSLGTFLGRASRILKRASRDLALLVGEQIARG
jgi:predicted unusual protein kinase regulating ubiquinone biosynthesis (AarF/ABC1/UbiB family)